MIKIELSSLICGLIWGGSIVNIVHLVFGASGVASLSISVCLLVASLAYFAAIMLGDFDDY